jgi:hypothetical protein
MHIFVLWKHDLDIRIIRQRVEAVPLQDRIPISKRPKKLLFIISGFNGWGFCS